VRVPERAGGLCRGRNAKSMPGPSITWVLERDVFASGDTIRPAASAAGHRVIDWSDEWWSDSVRPRLTGAVLFHGSLGNADRIPRELPWKPGAYCQTTNFHCSAWYPAATEWLLHDRWEIHPASRFIRRLRYHPRPARSGRFGVRATRQSSEALLRARRSPWTD